MEKQMKWGLATLLLLLGIAAVFLFLDQNAELQQLEKETAESDKLRQEHNKPQETLGAVEELPLVVRPNEHPSGPHQQENGTVHNPSVSQVSQTYTGPLTYHEELLKTNPFEALRQQSKELNHWSLDYIPDFSPDDQLAADYARVEYLKRYIKVTGEVPEGVNQNQLDRSFDELHEENTRRIDAGKNRKQPTFTALTWVGLEPPLRWTDDGFPLWW